MTSVSLAKQISRLLAGFIVLPTITLAATDHWVNFGPYGGGVAQLAADPSNPSILYAGSHFNAMFKTVNGGATWSPITNGLTLTTERSGISAVVVDPIHPSTIYAASVSGYSAIYKSTNGGGKWEPSDNGILVGQRISHSLAIDPKNPAVLYTGTEDGGIFKTSDGGANWRPANIGLSDANIPALAVDPVTPAILYAGTAGSVFKSQDFGGSWAKTGLYTASTVTQLAVDPSNHEVLYVGTGGDGIFKSTDSGRTWGSINVGLPNVDKTFVNTLIINPLNTAEIYAGVGNELLAGSGGAYKSTDGGGHWSAINAGLGGTTSGIVSALTLGSGNPSMLYAASDGVFKSEDDGRSWSQNTSGIAATTINAVAIAASSPATFYVGTRVGVYKSSDGGASWSSSYAGLPTDMDVAAVAVDPAHSTTAYVGGIDLSSGIFKTTDGGVSWAQTFKEPTSAIVVDPSNPAIVYSVGKQVFKSMDSGKTWKSISFGYPSINELGISVIGLDPAHPATLYVGTNGHGAFKSTDAGNSWQPVNSGLLSSSIRYITIDPIHTNVVYIGADKRADSDRPGGYKSTDGGLTWNFVFQYHYISGGIAVDPSNTGFVYIGASDGIYRSTDGGSQWNLFNTGLASVTVSAMAAAPLTPPAASSTIYAGTQGGGVYKLIPATFASKSQLTRTATPQAATTRFAPDDKLSQRECLFDWAEIAYPKLFASGASLDNSLTTPFDAYIYRLYSSINASIRILSDTSIVGIVNGNQQALGSKAQLYAQYSCSGLEADNCLFAKLEQALFNFVAQPDALSRLGNVYAYRYYSGTQSYLGIYVDEHVHYLKPGDAAPADVGPMSYWLPQANCL